MLQSKEFDELADELTRNLKSPQDVSDMWLTKVAMERALEIEMEEHLGEKKQGQRPHGNSRNGYSPKTLKTDIWACLIFPPSRFPVLSLVMSYLDGEAHSTYVL